MKTLFSPSAEAHVISALDRIASALEHYIAAYDAVAAQSGMVVTPTPIAPDTTASDWIGISDDTTTAILEAEDEARALGLKPSTPIED